ncbi:MAG: exodeoxyribonuclease VII large subunit [Gemmatimonas sp.]
MANDSAANLDLPMTPGGNAPVFTVTEIAAAVKRTVEETFGRVRVRGEICEWKVAASGHAYLRLKDTGAILDSVIWRGSLQKLGLRPEEGMEVIATGRITTYAGKSSYQLIIDSIELAGQGALLKLIEDRKKRLAAEGLFDASRKKPLPFLPEVIGVVTSPKGAVIRDILHRLADRFPRHVLIWPVPVQGEGAAEKIAAAIDGFNALAIDGRVARPDLLIVARGGGSLEDLMPFNEEVVVRAAAASDIPLISAVGHETDTTLIDYASDRRAPTPTAAAEMAVPVRRELIELVSDRTHRLLTCTGRFLTEREEKVRNCGRLLGDPSRLLEGPTQALDRCAERLKSALSLYVRKEEHKLADAAGGLRPAVIRSRIGECEARLKEESRALRGAGARLLEAPRQSLAMAAKLLENLSYKSVLDRGFAVVRDSSGHAVTLAAAAATAGQVAIEFADGTVGATIGDAPAANPAAAPKPAPAAKPKRKPEPGASGQGSLL